MVTVAIKYMGVYYIIFFFVRSKPSKYNNLKVTVKEWMRSNTENESVNEHHQHISGRWKMIKTVFGLKATGLD